MSDRRSTDALILEMHGMLFKIQAQLDGHMKWEEGEHLVITSRMNEIEKRVEPLEETRKSLKAVWTAFGLLGGSFLAGIGLSIWFWIKSKLVPHLPIQ